MSKQTAIVIIKDQFDHPLYFGPFTDLTAAEHWAKNNKRDGELHAMVSILIDPVPRIFESIQLKRRKRNAA